jgi:flagellar motor switch/type III secretory pathway protein FliN
VGLAQVEGEPVNLLINDALIAKGEVLVDKEKYGIRIVEVVSRAERVKSLK